MKHLISILTLLLIFFGCKNYISKIDDYYKYNHIADYHWEGQFNGNNYELSLIRGEGIWFDGFLIVNRLDTFQIHGFVKGPSYPSSYVLSSDQNKKGFLMMEYLIDSVPLNDRDRIIFDEDFYIFKEKKL